MGRIGGEVAAAGELDRAQGENRGRLGRAHDAPQVEHAIVGEADADEVPGERRCEVVCGDQMGHRATTGIEPREVEPLGLPSGQ